VPDIEPRPIDPSLEPAQRRALNGSDLLRRAASDLTPFQLYRAGQKISRQRMKTTVALAELEDDTLLAEARAIAQGKVRSTEEQVERLLHAERVEAIAQAALAHEAAQRVVDLVQDEAAHSIFKDGLKAVSSRYVSGVARRSGN
jgi:hypothetical protein